MDLKTIVLFIKLLIKFAEWLKEKYPEIKVEIEKIDNDPQGGREKDDKNSVNNFARKYNITLPDD